MASVKVIDENGNTEELTVSSDDIRAQVLAMREVATAMRQLANSMRGK